MPDFGINLRRLMARLDLTVQDVIDRSGLDTRTVKEILRGSKQPQARTIHRLASGLGVASDEFFQDPSLLAHRVFDRQTNPIVDRVIASHPNLFRNWTEADFDELYSRFGTGGPLSVEGTVEAAENMNVNRQIYQRVSVLLESSEASLLSEFVNLLYRRVAVPKDNIASP